MNFIDKYLYPVLMLDYMARTDAVGMLDDAGNEVLLAEVYGKVVDIYQKKSGVARVKAQGIGEPTGGSMEFSRFQNAVVRTYGTARTAGEGDEVLDDKVTVNLSTHKEIVEELERFDIKTHGVGNIMARRAVNHGLRMLADLDRAALAAAKTAAAAASQATDITYPNATTPDYLDLLEQTIQKVEAVTNDYVDGVPREMIVVFLRPAIYGKIQNKLDTVYAYNGSTDLIQVPGYHGVQIISEHYLPASTDFIVTTVGNIAQPVVSDGYEDGGRISLTKAYEVSLFYDYGTAMLAPDLVFEGEYSEASA